jgi:serine/threonine-protein kinase
MPPLDGATVDSGNLEAAEAERRFVSCVKLIERVHAAGIVCGDLCASSFLVGRGGETRFVGVMGSFDTEAAATAMLPPMETLHFVSPEQRAGAGIETASDVFALGVLGYKLLTGAFPYPAGSEMFTGEFNPEQIKPVSAFTPFAPVWAEEVLMRCLNANPAVRYSNAGEILRAIAEVRHQVEAGQRAPAQTAASAGVRSGRWRRPTQDGARSAIARTGAPGDSPSSQESRRSTALASGRLRRGLAAIAGLAVVATATFLFLSTQRPQSDTAKPEQMHPLDRIARNTDLQDAVPKLSQADRVGSSSENEELRKKLEVLVNSNDPLAHELLVKSAKQAVMRDARDLSEGALLDRARRLGLKRAAEQVRQWLRTIKDNALPPIYEAVLRSLDSTLPLEARTKTITQTYAANPKLALRLAASLALDSPNPEEYRALLAQLMIDHTHNQELSGRSALALILADPELALVYEDDVIQLKDNIPEKDTLWVLKILAERSDQAVRSISNLAIERKLLSPSRQAFLSLVRDRTDLPTEVQASLIHAAAGAATASDIANFGRWYDPQSEEVLLAILAEGTDRSIVVDTFDTLAGKNLKTEPSASILAWVRQNQWDNRADYAQLIGVLGRSGELNETTLQSVLPALDKAASDRSFVEILLGSGNPRIVRLAIDRYRDQLGIAGLINLLDNGDPSVRISAVRSLKDVNEIAILKVILDKYEAEKDPAVKTAYQETFWMIKGRERRN